MEKEEYVLASKLCAFISTLCAKNQDESCREESSLCARVATLLASGKPEEAKKICYKARMVCPKGRSINAS